MTADRSTPRGARPRNAREDLLHDLRATVPVPAAPPPVAEAPVAGPATDAPPAADPARTGDAGTPAVEVRLTPLRWSGLRAAPAADRTGVLFSVGPLQVFLGRRTD
jgi:hypothetical protein